MSLEKIIELRGHYDKDSNDVIAVICDFLIEQFTPAPEDNEIVVTPQE